MAAWYPEFFESSDKRVLGHVAKEPLVPSVVTRREEAIGSTSLAAKFEADIERAAVSGDVVQAWCSYATWASKQDRDAEAAVLARACRTLSKTDKFRDDIRYLRLWVLFANKQEKPEDALRIIAANGVGTRHALLYEAWASMLEKKRRFVEADRVYKRGIAASAQPLGRLESEQKRFNRRMHARKRRDQKENALEESANVERKAKTETSLPDGLKSQSSGPARSTSRKRAADEATFVEVATIAVDLQPGEPAAQSRTHGGVGKRQRIGELFGRVWSKIGEIPRRTASQQEKCTEADAVESQAAHAEPTDVQEQFRTSPQLDASVLEAAGEMLLADRDVAAQIAISEGDRLAEQCVGLDSQEEQSAKPRGSGFWVRVLGW